MADLPATSRLDRTLQRIVERTGVPGLAAALLHGPDIAMLGCAGVRRRGSTARLAPDDRFHLGSCTKAMTATLVGLTVDQGRLDWHTTLAEIFGSTLPRLHPGWQHVQLAHVLAHRAGLPPNPSWRTLAPGRTRRVLQLREASLRRQRLELTGRVLATAPRFAPGATYEYSNVAYIIAGVVLERINREPWEEQMRARLWRPLGITTGGFGAPGTPGVVDQPRGHAGSGRPVAPGSLAADWRVPPLYGPAGTAHLSLPDWARFIALHLRGHAANPHHEAALLRPETFAALHTPAAGEAYAGGWEVSTRAWARGADRAATGRVLHHDGSNGQWYAVTWLAPERDLALLAATNQNGAPGLAACEQVLAAFRRE
ncbi:serine hydrolase domain-containing protein [Opitutus terrae]|uniref:Beta-lactamase n=1 Tax=Opitutus terrae (strain DSM 11246 / JCM 15787 / PB90-1) TaxID=452637 RepID=B1ZYJ8_OPITP|nr:serine hydrolase domain-containing protein [Opitutus terrae]ACB75234.1 beta-lactamase [Opitutus terrae PB90-1]